MANAGWYGDPTREGRLRYWDGAAWTEHVSEGGGTATEPITGIPPAPPAAPPADGGGAAAAGATQVTGHIDSPAVEPAPFDAAADAPATGGTPYAPTVIGRAGFVLAAIGGVLVASAAGSTAVDQGFVTISVAGGSWLGVVAAVLCIAAAAAPWVWARVVGVTVSGAFAVIVALALIGFRSSDDLVPGVDVSLGTAGWLMFFGSLLLFAGTAVALAWFRVPARGPEPAREPAKGKGVVSLILGILGVVFAITAPAAIAFGLMALDDVKATDGRIEGKGLAKAGIILGIVWLVLWGVGLILAMLLTQP